MINEQQLRIIGEAIYSIPELYGSRIGFYGNYNCQVVQQGLVPSVNYSKVVIIEELDEEVPVLGGQRIITPGASPQDDDKLNRSRIGRELVGATLSCGFALVATIGVVTGAATTLATGGTSVVLTIAAWSGMVTGTLQCANGIVRAHEAWTHPDIDSLNALDNDPNYVKATFIVDAIGVVSGAAGIGRSIGSLIVRNRALVQELQLSGRTLERMSRFERRRVIQEAIWRLSRHPEAREELIQILRTELNDAQIQRILTHSTRRLGESQIVQGAIDRVVANRMQEQIVRFLRGRDNLITYSSWGVNAMPSELVGSASGSINTTGSAGINWVINVFDN